MINMSLRTLYLTTLPIFSTASCYIIILNYTNGIYPTTQDTVAIPLVSMAGLLAILLLLSAAQNPFYKQLHYQKATNITSITLALFSTTASSALLIKSINYWLTPNHLGISALYFFIFTTYVIHQLNIYKKFTSQKK
jgi:hypothetical protein